MTSKRSLGNQIRGWLILAILSAPVSASAAEPTTLMRLIEVLHADGTISDAAYEMLIAEAAASAQPPPVASVPAPVATATAVTAKEREPEARKVADVRFDSGGLTVEGPDENFAVNVGGRLHVDSALYDSDRGKFSNGAELRRARIEVKADFFKDWRLSMAVGFDSDGAKLRSNYFSYRGFDSTELFIGLFKEPFGLERLSSSNGYSLMERASVTNAFVPGRNFGIAARTNHGPFSVSSGFFWDGEVGDDEEDEGWAHTTRVTFAPWSRPGRVLHLGGAFSYRELGDDNGPRFRARPESHVTNVRLVDTGDLDARNEWRYAAEAAFTYGPFSVQAEYMGASVDTRGNPNLTFSGFYAYASAMLTGETRPYNRTKAVFARVIPDHPVGRDGWGAFETAVRFSRVDLSNNGVRGGRQDLLTVGLNWYLNANLRFMANYVQVLDLDQRGPDTVDAEPSIFQVRGQVAF